MILRPFTIVLLFAAPALAEAPPRSVDPRIAIELFAESPQIKTPTGIDVDSQGRVWAIESNTHFRPENYDGHPSDRLLVLTDTDNDGRCDKSHTFADGFEHAMSVAVRPVWMDEVELPDDEALNKAIPAWWNQPNGWSDVQEGKKPPVKQKKPQGSKDEKKPFQVFLATRRAIWLLEDTDDDLVCDRRTEIAWLDTKGNYPHNGLAGFAFDGLGWMYFGFGENIGESYALSSREIDYWSKQNGGKPIEKSENPTPEQIDRYRRYSARRPLVGGGEGGNMYRMRPDGTDLSQWATGFWNPHASCVDALGRLFTVDNDPDSRPPCRLLHVIQDGDYGYRFRNGRNGLHPFTSWNGEIPGTLPMVAGTGEAPSGVLAYEHDALPEEYHGRLFVTSWGDHRIDTFKLKPRGKSVESIAEPLITGGENFRPVGIALAPDGSMYCTDWVVTSYQVHGQGRVWRIRPVKPAPQPEGIAPDIDAKSLTTRRLIAKGMSNDETGRKSLEKLMYDQQQSPRVRAEAGWALGKEYAGNILATDRRNDLRSLDPFVATAAMQFPRDYGSADPDDDPLSTSELSSRDAYVLLRSLRSGAWRVEPDDKSEHAEMMRQFNSMKLTEALKSASPVIRRLAVQWAAEEKMTYVRRQIENALRTEPMTTDLFLATIAALEILDGKSPAEFDQTPAGKYVQPLLKDEKASAATKAQALRLVDPADPALPTKLLLSLAEAGSKPLRIEAFRTLASSGRPEALEFFSNIVAAPHNDLSERKASLYSEALLGLGAFLQNPATADRARGVLVAALAPIEKNFPEMTEQNQMLATGIVRALRPAGDKPEVQGVISEYASMISRLAPNSEPDADEIYQQSELAVGANRLPEALKQHAEKSRLPASEEEWRVTLSRPVQLGGKEEKQARGRIVFYSSSGAGCYKCHTVNGRGGNVGPDLSRIGGALSREKLIDSILEPSKEISPQFTTWSMATADGLTHVGMVVQENLGQTTIGDSEGKTVTLKTIDILDRVPQRVSVMPDKLESRLTVQEFRDLISFLESLN